MKIMIALIQIVNNVHCGSASRIDTATKILALTSDNIDPIITKLLLCVKSMIETLPSDNQTEEIQEFELCTRYLQLFFQPLFDSGDDKVLFKWTNTIGLKNNGNNILTKSRPDGCVKDSRKPISFIKVKPIDKSKDHRKINLDLHRLGIFAKEVTTEYKLKHTFEIMAIGKFVINKIGKTCIQPLDILNPDHISLGTNIKFYLSQPASNVLIMVELDSVHLPLSLDELSQFLPYLDRLYNVMEAIFNCCYSESNICEKCDFGASLEPRVVKAITERSVDRTRDNCFYYPYH